MKKYIIYILFGSTALIFSACQEDFLDRNPQDQISSANFWQSKADFDMALTSSYGSLQGGGGIYSYGMPNWDALTDNGYGQHNYWGSQAIVQGDISPSTGGYITDVYNSSYNGIARVNIFLAQLSSYEGSDIDTNTKAQYEAEARFIRAYYYFQLYFSYGSVPIITEPLTLENQIQPKSEEAEVLAQIITDLDFAIANLPDETFAQNTGHAVASSAQAMKARVLMYAAYDENGNPDPELLTQARDLTLEVMSTGYELNPVFENVFRDGTQEGNEEIIFSIKFLAPDNATPMDQWFGDWLVVSPLQNLVDAYEYEDGLPYGESPLTNPDDPIANRDPRLEKTIFVDEVNINGNVHNPSNNLPTGYGVKKFLSPGLMPYGYSTQSQQDWVMLRYADVLLMYAEAQNELNGPDESVYDAINTVRSRVDMPDLPQGLSQEEMRERIRHERRVELAFEGLRFYDLKRWRIADEVLNNVEDGVLSYTFEERFYHWPLPQTEIDKSQGELEQNPAYQ
ncbi:RagB/SusD family nutrient uptake outer membrane protein [Catalinimonas niigatensis]|uniref:RagB/SusD family nutrient uptake outer membrane protein n=1 Tax=Catalinimonas niigatensis TaxID=1397264 RepID=UPI0026655BAE|nr:RagB/SusD family nutrient uptake outer membrane protein [Catalinimonas niigatensis]WPP49763.1 RagB/SusD family nutrient uptake outer membrane protein [Catalinimonas niigatensis]